MGDPVAELAPRFEREVASFARRGRLPGVAAGVVHGDELVWGGGAGFADLEQRRPSGAAILYRIGSITKTFTSVAVMQLRDRGALRLDDPVVTHLPEFAAATNPFGPIEDVTVRRLLMHESGLMGDADGVDWGLRSYPAPAETLERLDRVRVVIPPDSASKYSNLGFRLLGEIVSKRSGSSYEEHVRRAILDPLGMTSTTFVPDAPLADRVATGYDGRVVSDELTPARGRDLTSAGAEGGLWSSVEDLARWISFQLTATAGDRSAQVLAGSSLAEAHRMRIISDDAWTDAFGLGFYGVRKGDHVYVGHSGGIFGFTSDLRFHAGTRTGAVVLVNGVGDAGELCVELAGAAREAATDSGSRPEPPPTMPAEYGSLLGRYVVDGLPDVYTVEWRGGALTFVDPSQEVDRPTLVPEGDGDLFTVRTGRDAGEPAVFLRTSDGRVRGVRVATTTYARLEPVSELG